MDHYDSIIVGGGIAGLQAAIQLGRYEHRVLVIDAGYGRSTLCRSYHNVLGWPDGISGSELRRLGRLQAERLGVVFVRGEAVRAVRKVEDGAGFELWDQTGKSYEAVTLLLATGLLDSFPDLPGLTSCLGLTVYVCPDCDGYEISGRRTIVLGSGDAGAGMAITLSSRTREIVYINHGKKAVKEELMKRLEQLGIACIAEDIKEVSSSGDDEFHGVRLADGRLIEAERGFIAFGGNEVKSDLARQLGAERLENRHIMTDPRSKMTSVPYLWAAGDVGVHAEQVTIAMGEGSQAAIWMHKALIKRKEAELGRKEPVRS